MMKRCNGFPDRRCVQRTTLQRTDHRLMRALVHELQTELAGSGDHDGGPRVQRYLPEFEKRWQRYARPWGGSWRMDEAYIRSADHGCTCTEPLTKRPDGGFLSQSEPRRERRQIVSPRCDEAHSRTLEDHVGRLCGLARNAIAFGVERQEWRGHKISIGS